jgi:hypothetical protein
MKETIVSNVNLTQKSEIKEVIVRNVNLTQKK